MARVGLLAVVWVLGSLLYLWTATSSGDRIVLDVPQHDYYNQLTNGFLRGELSIPTVPPPALVHLKDPYDPAQNAPWQAEFHDLSLYDGHLYLSWGPSPVLTLFLPWRALGVGGLPENLAALIYAVVGLGFFLALLELLVDRHLPDAATWRVTLCGVALATSSVVAYLLRRPLQYEVALVCAYCFIGAGLYLLALARTVRRGRLLAYGLGSLSLGIAVGARFETLLLGAVVTVLAVEVARHSRGAPGAARLGRLCAVTLPWCVATLAVLAYNFARFHNPFQIGSAYQLAGFDPTKIPYEQLGYVPPSLYYYVFAPVRITAAFPFLALPPPPLYPGTLPASYGAEVMAGVLTTSPILLALLAATFVLRGRHATLGRIVLGLAVLGLALLGAIAFTVPGGTMRYEVDFASLLLVAACLTWLAWRPVRWIARAAVAALGALAVVAGALVGVAVSITGPNDQMLTNNYAGYVALQDHFSFVDQAFATLDGGAQVIRVIMPGINYPSSLGDYGTWEPGTQRFELVEAPEEVDIATPSAGTYELSTRMERTASGPARGGIVIHLKSGSRRVDRLLRYGRPYTVRLRLAAGLNRVFLWATPHGRQPVGAYPEIVNVYGLSVEPVHDRT